MCGAVNLPARLSSNPVMAISTDAPGVWAVVRLARLWQDIRYGCRMLAANPAFTLSRSEAGHPLWGPVYRRVSP